MPGDEALREAIHSAAPALWSALSPLGRRVAFPPDIPFQAAQARTARLNGTIGQVTDGAGRPLAIPAMTAAFALDDEQRDRAFLYSPVQGIESVRQAWRSWQRRGVADDVPSSLPIVTAGLTHGLSLAADLFGSPERAVAVAAPFWGNYRQTFTTRTGARVVTADAYRDGHYHPHAYAEALAGEPGDHPVMAIVNLPSNPGGYMPTAQERGELVTSLREIARRRPLVVLCDDAYAGLVYEEVPGRSLFWDLVGLEENLVPVKIDGATKEFSYFGGRVGFLTFPFEPESEAALALESKVKCLTRAVLGSPVATAQVVLEQGLAATDIADQVERVRRELEGRYRELSRALATIDSPHLRPLPFNAGCFALVELAGGLDPDRVRRHLLEHHSTGLISIQPSYLRIAFCSVRGDDLPRLVDTLVRGVHEMAADGG